jgi:purine nucleoside permease
MGQATSISGFITVRKVGGSARVMSCVLGVLALCGAAAVPVRAAAPRPLDIRVVVVTAFEIGQDTGDKAGEFQAWAAEMPQVLPFPAGYRHLRYDPRRKTLLISTGIGTNRAASSIMALGLDPRFDLRHAYWLVAAIAGVNPARASIGSQAWIGDVIDSDYAYAIDPREAPKDWPVGIFARGSSGPYRDAPAPDYNLFPLNHGLRDWAFCLTRQVSLPDNEALQHLRAAYVDDPAALAPPAVITGDEASGQTFWHGALMTRHVDRWVSYWTGGKGAFVMSGMEDTGVAAALSRLAAAGRADAGRLMVLRGGSNYTMPPAGQDAAANLLHESGGFQYSGLQPALDGVHKVGRVVVDELADHWATYRDHVPDGRCGAPAR